jgi:glycosyltransferase involved in cell wall biosynthesis
MDDATRLEDLLAREGVGAVDALGPVEILVGVPALNHARSVERVVDGLATGLARGFPAAKSAVLVVDGGSGDGTLEAATAWTAGAPAATVACVRLPGPPRWGRAVLTPLAAARHLSARACAFVTADLVGAGPEWIEGLLDPILRDAAEYVSPAYSRTAAEGTLTTNLLAPLTRALYGVRAQQVVGGCAALSAGLVEQLLAGPGWVRDTTSHGVEVRLGTEALLSGRPAVETHLGAKQVDPGLAPPDLTATLVGIVGPLFQLMERHAAAWQDVRGSRPIALSAEPPVFLAATGEVHADRMVRAFRLGLKDLLPVWEQIMPEDTLGRLYPLGLLAPDEFQFPPPMWARVVSDFAVAHRERRLAREHLLKALAPLYLGRVAAFLLEAQAGPPSSMLDALERIGLAFEAEKPLLAERWR